jgi:hypothetical protein
MGRYLIPDKRVEFSRILNVESDRLTLLGIGREYSGEIKSIFFHIRSSDDTKFPHFDTESIEATIEGILVWDEWGSGNIVFGPILKHNDFIAGFDLTHY